MKDSFTIESSDLLSSEYVTATYWLKSKKTLWDAAYAIAVGQSIGNPGIRNSWETEEMLDAHAAKIVLSSAGYFDEQHSGVVQIAFPLANIDFAEDGISQLTCFLMGGHLDIDIIEECHLLDVDLEGLSGFDPWMGLSGIRKFTGVLDKPLLGGIVKPKTGMSPSQLLDNVKAMIDGGVNFIKEDEILGNPVCCPFKERLKLLAPYLRDKRIVYCFCVNADYPYCIERAKMVAAEGGNGVHVNVWCGLGIYKAIRELDLPLFIHFQKSGDKAFTNAKHNFHVAFPVLCRLAALSGVDSMHAGMPDVGGYSSSDDVELNVCLKILRDANVLPALSCGMHPGNVNKVTRLVGPDYLANTGGSIHGCPGGTRAGALAMYQSINGDFNGKEYKQAIEKWGIVG